MADGVDLLTIKPSEIAGQLQKLANDMFKRGTVMEYFGGHGEMGEHGRQLIGAAQIAAGWVCKIDIKDSDE
jgi:hypothetical protein